MLLLLFIACIPLASSAQTENRKRIYGKIKDKATNESLPYASVRIRKTTQGCSSDNNGYFSFFAQSLSDTLVISSIGYKEVRIPLNSKTRFPLNVKMEPENYELAGVTIKPKREKYRKKDNPAVILVKKITEQRNDNSPEQKPFYTRNRHEKLNIALNNFSSAKESHFGKK